MGGWVGGWETYNSASVQSAVVAGRLEPSGNVTVPFNTGAFIWYGPLRREKKTNFG